MSTGGQSGGTRRRRAGAATTMTSVPAIHEEPLAGPAAAPLGPAAAPPAGPGVDPGVELLDDRSISITSGHRGLGLRRSLPGALAGTMLVVGLAFGAALGQGGAHGPARDTDTGKGGTALAGHGGPSGHEGSSEDGGATSGHDRDGKEDWFGGWGEEPQASEKPDGDAGEPEATDKVDGGEPDATAKPDVVEPTRKPEPDATPKPEPRPDPTKPPVTTISLALAIKEYHPLVEWGSCGDLDFDYYKVVRSSDSTVSWPKGEGDELVAAVERGGTRKAWDEGSPHGKKVWYRVFCVRDTDAGYKAVRASATRGIEVPEEPAPPPPPDPITLGLEVVVNDEGKVVLSWSTCEADGFAFYKVVKSTWNENPSYLPWTDGTEVLAAIGEMGATEWHDWAPESGETAWYRVQCLGYSGDHKVLLGESAVVSVTTP
jgi:hypothetical protein